MCSRLIKIKSQELQHAGSEHCMEGMLFSNERDLSGYKVAIPCLALFDRMHLELSCRWWLAVTIEVLSFITLFGAGMTEPWRQRTYLRQRWNIWLISWGDGACASLMLFEVKFFPLFFRIDYNFTPLEVCSLTWYDLCKPVHWVHVSMNQCTLKSVRGIPSQGLLSFAYPLSIAVTVTCSGASVRLCNTRFVTFFAPFFADWGWALPPSQLSIAGASWLTLVEKQASAVPRQKSIQTSGSAFCSCVQRLPQWISICHFDSNWVQLRLFHFMGTACLWALCYLSVFASSLLYLWSFWHVAWQHREVTWPAKPYWMTWLHRQSQGPLVYVLPMYLLRGALMNARGMARSR